MKIWIMRTSMVLIVALLGFLASLVIMPDVATSAVVSAERSLSGLETKQTTLPTGELISYLEGGDLKGETLLLLHGFGANKDHFTRLARKLDGYHILIPDLVGFGESAKPKLAKYTSARQAYRLRLFVEKKTHDNRKLHIAGSSMGGLIALAFAARYPDTVKSLYLLAPGGFHSIPPTPLMQGFGKSAEDNPLLVKSANDYIKLYDLTMSKPPYVPATMLKSFAKTSIANHELESRIAQQLINDSIEARASTLAHEHIPTRIIWGGDDKILDANTAKHAKTLMPHSQIAVWQGIGHLPMIEDVDKTARDYLQFLNAAS